jgi:hypothetical protein
MRKTSKSFAICLDNAGDDASLIPGKVYRVRSDPAAAKAHMVRVIDETGEDYLFDESQFVLVDFPEAVRRRILRLQRAG